MWRQQCTDVQTARPAVRADLQNSLPTRSALKMAQWKSSREGTHNMNSDRVKNIHFAQCILDVAAVIPRCTIGAQFRQGEQKNWVVHRVKGQTGLDQVEHFERLINCSLLCIYYYIILYINMSGISNTRVFVSHNILQLFGD